MNACWRGGVYPSFQALFGDNLFPIYQSIQHQATGPRLAIDQHGAGAAHPDAPGVAHAIEVESDAENLEQGLTIGNREAVLFPVFAQVDR